MKFLRFNRSHVEFYDNVITRLESFRQNKVEDKESGGILIGRFIIGTNDVVIHEVTIPTKADRRNRSFFKRSKKATQNLINAMWKNSNGTLNYLGEWHTHPEDIPSPSEIDLNNWYKITQSAYYEQEFLFFVIVGRKKLRIWESNKNSLGLCELIAYDDYVS